MKAKEYLMKIRAMDVMIDSSIEELEVLQTLACKTTASFGGERVQSSGNSQKVEIYAVKILAQKQKINDEIDRFVDFKEEARKLVNESCDADCNKLLKLRYFGKKNEKTEKIEYWTWERIATEMGFTFKWVSGGLHQRALSQVQKGLDQKGE